MLPWFYFRANMGFRANMKFLLSTILLFALVPSAKADIYTYTDANGIVHFSNVRGNKNDRVAVATQRDENRSGQPRGRVLVSQSEKEPLAPLVEEAARA